MADLTSARKRLQWARDSIEALEGAASTFFATNPPQVYVEHNPFQKQWILFAKWSEALPSELEKHATSAGENLRSALDHAAWVTAVNSGETGEKATHFPFLKSNSTEDRRDAKKNCKQIPQSLFDYFVDRFKPYPQGDNRLYALNGMRNASEHRTIKPTPVIHDAALRAAFTGKVEYFFFSNLWQPEQNLYVFCAVCGDDVKVQITTDFSRFAVALADIEPTTPAVVVLRELADTVGRVIDGTENELKMLGLI